MGSHSYLNPIMILGFFPAVTNLKKRREQNREKAEAINPPAIGPFSP